MAARMVANGDVLKRTTDIVAASSNYTVVFWKRFTAASAVRVFYVTFDAPGTYVDYVSMYETVLGGPIDSVQLDVSDPPDFDSLNSANNVEDVWYPIAYVRSGNNHSLYWNRTLVGTVVQDITTDTYTETWLGWDGVAAPPDNKDQEFQYFREWNAALTLIELTDEWNSPVAIKTANLWRDTPLTADGNDISGNARHWTVVGSVSFTGTDVFPSRFYPSVKATNSRWHGGTKAGGYGARGAEVPYCPSLNTYLLTGSKIDCGTAVMFPLTTNQQPNYDFYIMRFVTRPLQAQTVSGTFDCCFMELCRWSDEFGVKTADSIARSIFHIYISVGQTPAVRHTLLNKFVESVDWPFPTMTWKQLSSVQNLSSAAVTEGDSVVIEVAVRVVSSPSPTPHYPPDEYTEMFWRSTGTNLLPASTGVRLQDAVNGETTDQRAPWFQFSHAFAELPISSPPANDACVDAVSIPFLPYNSPPIDTTNSQGGATDREAWYKFTADINGKTCVDTRGSTYATDIDIFTGGCGVLTPVLVVGIGSMASHRSQSYVVFTVTLGTEYHIRITNLTSSINARGSGGLLIVNVYNKIETPSTDDILFPNGSIIGQWRNGQLINFSALFDGDAPTGLGIDYTRRPLDSLNGGINTNDRVLIGLHNFELVEILDLPTLSYGTPGQVEEDFIGDPWSVPGVNLHPAQLSVSPAGIAYVGWFGNGYLFVGGNGALPAILNAVSDNADYSALKFISAIAGDNQPGAPFTDTLQYPTVQHCAPWALSIDWNTGVMYYTSAGFYVPVVGSTAQEIRTFNILTATQGSVFANVTLISSANPGLKGVKFVSGVGVFVANGPVLQLYDFTGVLVRTYTPSISEDSQSLCGVRVINAKTHVWVHDQVTGRFFQFNVATGAETNTFETMGTPGTSVDFEVLVSSVGSQSAIYVIEPDRRNDNGFEIPTPTFRTGLLP